MTKGIEGLAIAMFMLKAFVFVSCKSNIYWIKYI